MFSSFSALALAAAFLSLATMAYGQVVISQVYGGGGNSGSVFNRDFVELYNRGSEVVCLDGWSVQYHPAPAASGEWLVTPLAGCIHPRHYFLVQQGTKANPEDTPPLPTPDIIGDINLHLESGRVALLATDERLADPCPIHSPALVDFVGYGDTSAGDSAAPCREGSGEAPRLSNTTAAVRLNGGATDTDDNAADFIAQKPAPRNSRCDVRSAHLRRRLPRMQ